MSLLWIYDPYGRKNPRGLLDDIAFAFVEQYKLHKNYLPRSLTCKRLDPVAKNKLLAMIQATATGEIELVEK